MQCPFCTAMIPAGSELCPHCMSDLRKASPRGDRATATDSGASAGYVPPRHGYVPPTRPWGEEAPRAAEPPLDTTMQSAFQPAAPPAAVGQPPTAEVPVRGAPVIGISPAAAAPGPMPYAAPAPGMPYGVPMAPNPPPAAYDPAAAPPQPPPMVDPTAFAPTYPSPLPPAPAPVAPAPVAAARMAPAPVGVRSGPHEPSPPVGRETARQQPGARPEQGRRRTALDGEAGGPPVEGARGRTRLDKEEGGARGPGAAGAPLRRVVGWMISFDVNQEGQEYVIREGRNLLGRARDADISIFYDDRVSATHATIVYRNGSFKLRDEMTNNGTFLNGKDIGPGETVALSNGDVLRLGRCTFKLFLLDPTEVARLWPQVGLG